MIDERKILYLTITDFQNAERVRRDDWAFDAWDHLAKRIGHKNPSTLRKMTEPRGHGNGAKLGVEDCLIIMSETNDYRLLKYIIERLKDLKREKQKQITLFDEPYRTLENIG